MDASRFDAIVKKRADEKVQAKIRKFRTELHTLLFNLTGVREQYPSRIIKSTTNTKVLSVMMDDALKWPASLWEDEQNKVEKELLATLDEMQMALLSLNKPEDPDRALPEEKVKQ